MQPFKAIRGLFFVVHPFPAAMNAVAGAAFYLYVADTVGPLDVAAVFGSILLVHAAIGSMNDYCDIDLDRHTKRESRLSAATSRPEPRSSSPGVGVRRSVVSLLVRPATLVIAVVVLTAGIAYDFWAKGTILAGCLPIFIPAVRSGASSPP